MLKQMRRSALQHFRSYYEVDQCMCFHYTDAKPKAPISWVEHSQSLRADQRFCFRCTDSAVPQLSKYETVQPLNILCACTAPFVFGKRIVGFILEWLVYEHEILIKDG